MASPGRQSAKRWDTPHAFFDHPARRAPTFVPSAVAHAADFADNWCRFDFFLVISALLDQFATELLAAYLPIPPMMLRILRVFRVMRLFRLLKGEHAKGLRDLLVTM